MRGDLTDIELTLMCEKFHALPSQIQAEDAYWMRRVFALSNELDRIRNMKRNRGRGKSGKGGGKS